jgi:hypothetical protein
MLSRESRIFLLILSLIILIGAIPRAIVSTTIIFSDLTRGFISRMSKKYHYVPYAEKKGTFYLLINPDNQKPWSYEGWMETVIKTGDIISTNKLPRSGFIV